MKLSDEKEPAINDTISQQHRAENASEIDGHSVDMDVIYNSYVSPEMKKRVRKKLYPNLVDILAIIGVILGASLIAGLIGSIMVHVEGVSSGFIKALMYFLQFAIAIGFVVFQRRLRGAESIIIKTVSGKINISLILWGTLLMMAMGVVIEPLLVLFPSEYLEFLYQTLGMGGWTILTTVVLAPIMEEVLFRGLIQGSIAKKHGPVAGIIISALIFGLVHGVPQQVINAFFIGIILGYIYYRTHSLLTVIILHFINNGIAYMQLEIFGSDSANILLRTIISNDKIYYMVYGVSLTLLIVGSIAIIRNLYLQDKRNKMAQAEENSIATK